MFDHRIPTTKLGLSSLVALASALYATPSAAQFDSRGHEFAAVFMPGSIDAPQPHHRLELRLTAESTVDVTVRYPLDNPQITTTVSVPAGGFTVVEIPRDAADGWVADTTDFRAVGIVSEDPNIEVRAIFSNRLSNPDSASLVPVDALGRDYIVADYDPSNLVGLFAQFTVLAVEDDTTVTITPSTDLLGHLADQPFSVTLDAGEAYFGRSLTDDHSNSLTGTRVQSDKPVAVANGNRLAQVPHGAGLINHLFEMAWPTNTWGQNFVVSHDRVGQTTRYRALAASDDTDIIVNNTLVANLDAGEYFELDDGTLGGPGGEHLIQSNQPIFLVQYMIGNGFADGGPAMANVPPWRQYVTHSAFSYSNWKPTTKHFAHFFIADADIGTATFDGIAYPPQAYTSIPGSGYSLARVAVTPGRHDARSNSGHYVMMGSYDHISSELTPAAFGLEPNLNNPPVAECRDISVAGDPIHCLANGSIDDGSYDPDPGDQVTLSQSPAGPYGFGDNLVTLTATDNSGATDRCTATVTVVDEHGPNITPAGNGPFEICESGGGSIILDWPSVSDACASHIFITGRITHKDGQALAQPHFVLAGGSINLTPGSYQVKWQANDASNQSVVYESFEVTASNDVDVCCKNFSGPLLSGTGQGDAIFNLSQDPHRVDALGGQDHVLTGYSNDCMLGGAAGDSLSSAAGDDLFYGGTGNDAITGCLFGQGGTMEVWAGPGDDALYANYCDEGTLHGQAGDDVIYGSQGDDQIDPGSGRDRVEAGAGDDTVRLLHACEVEAGKSLDGGPGQDKLILPIPQAEVEAAGVTITGFEVVIVDHELGLASDCG